MKMKKVFLFKLVEWVDVMSDIFGCFLLSKKNVVLLLRKNFLFELGEYVMGVDGSGFGIVE